MSGVTQNQGHFLMGPVSDAVDGALASIHECAQRKITEQAGNNLVAALQFSTPQGQEVLEWLGEQMISQYAQVFARNQLDSLRKVARLSEAQISKLNDEFCRGVQGTSEAKIGGHVRLSLAVESLRNDPRTKSIKDRLRTFSDSAAVNAAAEEWFSWGKDVILGLFWFSLLTFALPILGLPLYRSILARPHSITSFTVQLSADGSNWTNVMCQGRDCEFDCSAVSSDPGFVSTHRFPQAEEARYLRLSTSSWENMDDGSAGADLRLGVRAVSPENGPSLVFAVLQDGQEGQAWLQAGCNREGAPVGVWASKEEESGLVQCCLNTPGVHTCTRDGCLAGDSSAGAAAKVSWHGAKSRCESRGWRLCSRQELEREASSGCCGSELSGTNKCGYDGELVWTNTTGGADLFDSAGRLHSDTAFENVRQVEVDLLRVRKVDGLSVQGAVADTASPGLACFYWIWAYPLPSGLGFLILILQLGLGLTTPSARGAAAWGLPLAWILPAVWGIVSILADPSVPSPVSDNPVCNTRGPPVAGVFRMAWLFLAQQSVRILHITLCPQLPGEYVWGPTFFICWGLIILGLVGQSSTSGAFGPIIVGFKIAAYVLFAVPFVFDLPKKYLFDKRCKAQARDKMREDVEKYEAAWEAAGGDRGQGNASGGRGGSNRVGDDTREPAAGSPLESIRQRCAEAGARVKAERAAAVAQMSPVNRLLFRMGAGPRSWQHTSRYARTGKYRQRTRDVDMLFEEAAMVNDHFLSKIDDLMSNDTGSQGLIRGPVKRPDRALQKAMRKYFMDQRCLTDLVRGCILSPDIRDVDRCLEVTDARTRRCIKSLSRA